MFRFAEDVDAVHVDAVATGLDALPDLIPEIRGYVHGPDLGVSDGAFHYVVVADFDTADDFATYREHPDHTAFIANHITGKVIDRAAIQYDTD